MSDKQAAGTENHTVLVATTRARATTPDTYFSGERATHRDFAEATISVPPTHKPGNIEWPSTPPGDPAKDFVARSAKYLNGDGAFRDEVNRELAKRPTKERVVFVFIHGYNTLFAEGLYRFTQVVHDSGFGGVPVLFTWASRGKLAGYVYDMNSATVARDALEETLTELSHSDATKIVILAHSMGNWLLMETLRQMAKDGNDAVLRGKIASVVLAAPDIDIDVFSSQMRDIGKPKTPFIIMLSKDDRALRLSSEIAGGKARVGGYNNEKALAELGAVVVDLTDIKAEDAARHDKFASIAAVAPQLSTLLQHQGLGVQTTALDGAFNTAGHDLGSFVKSTAQIAITLPVTLIRTPVALATGQ